MTIETLISALRKTDMYIEDIFMRGGCYRFHLFLKKIFPNASPYINHGGNHIVTELNGDLFDINGKIKDSDKWVYRPLLKSELPMVRRWSFYRNNLIKLSECPACEEPLIYFSNTDHKI